MILFSRGLANEIWDLLTNTSGKVSARPKPWCSFLKTVIFRPTRRTRVLPGRQILSALMQTKGVDWRTGQVCLLIVNRNGSCSCDFWWWWVMIKNMIYIYICIHITYMIYILCMIYWYVYIRMICSPELEVKEWILDTAELWSYLLQTTIFGIYAKCLVCIYIYIYVQKCAAIYFTIKWVHECNHVFFFHSLKENLG